ncbi:MAG: hypothetical protein ACI308_09770 [Muribaculaceae bacterium]
MKTRQDYSIKAKELLSNSELYEIKAGDKTPPIGVECTACAIDCALCTNCTACTTCKVCTSVVMDVIIIP